MLPDQLIVSPRQAHIANVFRKMTSFGWHASKSRREMIVAEKTHDQSVAMTIGLLRRVFEAAVMSSSLM